MAQLVVGAAGAVVGFFVGGPTGAYYGYAIASTLYAVTRPGPHSEGPRLQDLKVTGTEYGQTIPYVFGHPRVPAQIVWASDKREIANTTTQGKGGGPSYTEYTYEVDLLILVSDNEIAGVGRVWDNGKLVWSVLEGSTAETLKASAETEKWKRLTIYKGESTQLPDPVYEAAVGVGIAPAYRGRGSVFIEGLQLGASGQLPNLTFEIARRAETSGGLFFNAPLIENAEDTAADSVPPGISNPSLITYSSEGAAFNNDFENGDGAVVSFSGGKFATMSSGGKISFEVSAAPLGVHGPSTGTGDPQRFFHVDGFGMGAAFAFLVIDGEIILQTIVYSPGDPTITQSHGAPTSNLYRIEWNDPANTVRFYVGDVLIRTDAAETNYSIVTFGDASPGIGDTAKSVTGVQFADAVGYFGEAPIATITVEDETLEDVVEHLMIRAGYEPDEFDVSELSSITKPVRALAISQVGATRATIEMLKASHFFECVLSDKLYFRPRSRDPVKTIYLEDLGASNGPEGDPEPFALKLRNELEVPSQIAVTYSNVADDYQNGTEYSDRALSSQDSTTAVQIAVGMMPAEAKGVADAIAMDNVASLAGTTLKVPFCLHAELEASDVVNVVTPDASYRMRLAARKDSGGILEFEAVIDDADALESAEITDEDYIPQTDVQSVATTLWEAMDIPPLRDADSDAGWYGAVKRGVGDVWPGAAMLRSWDDVTFAQVATYTDQAVFGVCDSILPEFSGGNVFDESSTLTVDVGTGELSSSTRDAMLADLAINVLLVGSEVTRFRVATLLSPGVYALSGFIRGFRGTDWAKSMHVADERCVLLRTAGLRRIATESSQLNVPSYIKAVTFNRPLSGAVSEAFTDTGVSLKPFRPTDLRGARDASSNLTLTWKRQTRLSFRFLTEGVDPPIGEAVELYDVEIWNSTFTTLKRSILALTAPAAAYSTADQTTDFGSAQAVVYARVFQRSAVVGRGYPLQGAA